MNKKLILLGLGFFLLGVGGAIGFFLLAGGEEKLDDSKSKFSSCVVLDEEFCGKGEKVYYEGEFFGLGFSLPEGAKIYAPFKGTFSPNIIGDLNGEVYQAINVYTPQSTDAFDESTRAFYVFLFPKSVSQEIPVGKGDFLAEVSGKEVEVYGNYNAIINFQGFNPENHSMKADLNLFRDFFEI